MIRRMVIALVAIAAITLPAAQASGTQEARGARQYANCRALHRDWEHGVARSRAAANAEVADGYGRPHVSRALYRANRDLDANDDGVACEA
jgi:Ni/Co efflux regulator RcnB